MITTINEFKNINEAVDLRCPECGDNLGKDTENPKLAYCGNCGEGNIKNPRGYDETDESVTNEIKKNITPQQLNLVKANLKTVLNKMKKLGINNADIKKELEKILASAEDVVKDNKDKEILK